MMPMFFVDKFRPRPRRAVLARPRCSLFPRPPVLGDSVTPEQLQQLLLLADCLVKDGDRPGRGKLTDKSEAGSSRGSQKKEPSGSMSRKHHKRFCPYHCIRAEKEEEESETPRQDCEAAGREVVATSKTHSGQKWTTTLDCSAFKPTELKVQVDGDSVHVHALHDERRGGSRTTFEMRRVFRLPGDVSKADLECVYSADSGQLVLTAPRCTSPQPPESVSSSSDSPPSLTHASDSQSSENAREISAEAPDTCPSKTEGKRKCETQVKAEHKRRRTEDVGSEEYNSDQQAASVEERTKASATEEGRTGTDCSETGEGRTAEASPTEEGKATEASATSEGETAATAAPEEGKTTDASGKQAESPQNTAEDSGAVSAADKYQQSQTSTENSTTRAAGDSEPTTGDDTNTTPTDSDVTAVADGTRGEMACCDKIEASAPASQKDFSLTFDVEKFSPEDLEVTVAGNVMTLRGKREVTEDGFCCVERMERKVTLPDSVDPDSLKCVFTKNGHLVVKAA